jgi:hypothetical protein
VSSLTAVSEVDLASRMDRRMTSSAFSVARDFPLNLSMAAERFRKNRTTTTTFPEIEKKTKKKK